MSCVPVRSRFHIFIDGIFFAVIFLRWRVCCLILVSNNFSDDFLTIPFFITLTKSCRSNTIKRDTNELSTVETWACSSSFLSLGFIWILAIVLSDPHW